MYSRRESAALRQITHNRQHIDVIVSSSRIIFAPLIKNNELLPLPHQLQNRQDKYAFSNTRIQTSQYLDIQAMALLPIKIIYSYISCLLLHPGKC